MNPLVPLTVEDEQGTETEDRDVPDEDVFQSALCF
jgi:hypothetical protein